MSRAELARNARFAEISPEVGVLDEDALRRGLADDFAGTVNLLAGMSAATDEKLRGAALRLSRAVVLERSRAGRVRAGGAARPRPVRASLGGDLDIDRSLDGVLASRADGRPPGLDDLIAVQWGRPRTAFAIVVDRSGSMTGQRLTTAAVVAAACAMKAPDEYTVLSFAATVDVLRPLHSDRPAAGVVDQLLQLRGHGTTRLGDALRAAGTQLSAARARRRVVVLLSDCRTTDQDDSPEVARTLDELLILAPAEDHDQAAEFAAGAGARFAIIDDPAATAEILDRLLDGSAALPPGRGPR